MSSLSADLDLAVKRVAAGEVIGFPTETVYGVGASLRHPDAAARIYELKRRPATMPLMLHVGGVESIDTFAHDLPAWAFTLAERVWPGPLTLIAPARGWIDRRVLGGGDTAGMRAPDHALTLALIDALGKLEEGPAALAGTSANPHGHTPPTDAGQTRSLFRVEDLPFVLDGGPCALGIESTVVRVADAGPEILRPGALGATQIAEICEREVQWAPHAAPGRGRVVVLSRDELEHRSFAAGDAVIARFSRDRGVQDLRWIDLGDGLEAFARQLYAAVADLEGAGHERIFVEGADDSDLGRAINARLERMSG